MSADEEHSFGLAIAIADRDACDGERVSFMLRPSHSRGGEETGLYQPFCLKLVPNVLIQGPRTNVGLQTT